MDETGRVWSVDDLLAAERALLRRLSPDEAADACRAGAVLVDIRPESQRRESGELPGASIVDRNVLEWRLDPASPHRVPWTGYDVQVVVICQQGYSSSLAAANLQRLGLVGATDVVGGFEGWVASGLPVVGPGGRYSVRESVRDGTGRDGTGRGQVGQPVVHFEIIGKDAKRLAAYYSELFGWGIDADNPMGYGVVAREQNVNADGVGIGGGVGAGPDGYPGHVTFYVEVPDVEQALAQAERLGGTRVMGPERPMEGLEIGLFHDPEGHLVGVVKSA